MTHVTQDSDWFAVGTCGIYILNVEPYECMRTWTNENSIACSLVMIRLGTRSGLPDPHDPGCKIKLIEDNYT